MPRAARAPRRGVSLLLIVVVLLALFATIGLTFLLYASSQADAARLYREAQQIHSADIDPEHLAQFFLGQLLFDARDDAAGLGSALRGHGLMRNAWGLDYDIDAAGSVALNNNTVAFNGTGRLHHAYGDADPPALRGQDDYGLVNYTYFPADGFLRDPERLGYRADPAASRGPFTGGFNASYTYPDLNTLALGAARADGTLLMPSFHRPWLFGPLDQANPNWTSSEGKYKILRPRPVDNPPVGGRPGFPYPDDTTGDVKNLIGAPGGNDSVWLDLGYPVQTAPDGRRFKPLFAALVLDLDGRLNVNVHGNVRGADGGHASHQGWGPWEVNPSRAFPDPAEWANLFRGVAGSGGGQRLNGRYGPDLAPTGPLPAPFAAAPPFYARADYNGTASAPSQPPAGTDCFPTFPSDTDNGATDSLKGHPSIDRVQGRPAYAGPGDYDRRFVTSNLEKLLRFGDTGSGALTSELLQLCPQTFAADKARHLVTTDSADLDRPGAAPWLWGPASTADAARDPRDPGSPERLGGGGPKPFPQNRSMPPSLNSDFDPQGWRSLTAALGRIDLSRPLPNYPPVDPATGQTIDLAAFDVAQAARQDLAKAVYLRLIKATGAYDPTAFLNFGGPVVNLSLPSEAELRTLRWLAQLAVNVVDYVDADDVMTPFNWGAVGSPLFALAARGEWVFGIELPHVLINEVYAEYLNENGPDGVVNGRATKYRVNVWVELYNPFRSDPARPDDGAARLDGAYQLAVTGPNANLLSTNDSANVRGDPDGDSRPVTWSAPASIGPADGPGGGFFVVGPPLPIPGADAGIPAVAPAMRDGALTYPVTVTSGSVLGPLQPTVMLRRLACPTLPLQTDPLASRYNPYVTVDYAANVPLNRGATITGAGASPLLAVPVERRRSAGRREPYDGRDVAFSTQTPDPPLAGQPQHTFGAHNAPREDSFQWLVHLDRPPVSPVELLHVSACKPHQLTQMFRGDSIDGYRPFRHTLEAQLWDPTSPLYRLFEFLETGYRAGGTGPGRPIPGRVNLNAIWDPEVFLALCDPQPSNSFTADDVAQIYHWMLASRSPGGAPGPGDRPFKGLGAADYGPPVGTAPDGAGLADTLFRANPAHPLYDVVKRPVRLFEVARPGPNNTVAPAHPYQRFELLTKIFNSVTTRSNVFAVWLTVGFFEVTDPAVVPPRLGAELGRAENRQVRHRMFAIVDRSQPVRVFPSLGQPPVTAQGQPIKPGVATVAPSVMGGVVPGSGTWSIQPGAVLHVRGPGPDGITIGEAVAVTTVGLNDFTATFTQTYPYGLTSIAAFGNPGPGADPSAAGGPLILHLSVIQ